MRCCLYPFPKKELCKAAANAKTILDVEMSMGQMIDDVRLAVAQRVAIDSVAHIREAKSAIRKAFENEQAKRGLSIVEVLSTCPTNWGLSPVESMKFIAENMIPYYPLGVYKDSSKEADV